jgi:hypothetical protein
MIVAIHTAVTSAQRTLTKKAQPSSLDLSAASTIAGLHAIVTSYKKGERRKEKAGMRNQLKMGGYVEYEEIEKSRLEELEDAEEELEELESRVALVKNTLFFIFVFAMGVAVGLHL